MDDNKLALQMWEKALDFLDKRFPKDWGGCAVMYTEEGKFVFNLFSFYRVNQEYNFRRVNFRDDSDFLQYLETMRSHSWYQRSGLQFKADDRIITMYTCTNDNIKTNRYVAVAVLKNCLLNE